MRLFDRLTEALLELGLLFALLLGLYALWDGREVDRAADPAVYRAFRPAAEEGPGFEALRAINPDVFAWLRVDGTPIDYPVVQTDNNETYLSTDAQGRWSLSGAIFLDYRNDPEFKDFNSILYGHHMEKRRMFGAVSDFADPAFFASHPSGELYVDGESRELSFFALALTDAYDALLLEPGLEGGRRQELLDRLEALSLCRRELSVTTEDTLVLLSTCTDAIPNGRYLLAGILRQSGATEEGNIP